MGMGKEVMHEKRGCRTVMRDSPTFQTEICESQSEWIMKALPPIWKGRTGMNKTIKTLAVALATAATIAMPFSAEAHFLSSRQEKEIGNEAVKDFMNEYQCERNWVLDHIQKRLLQFNSNKLWMYGTFGKKRGLEPVLLAKINTGNAVSYGGGQIFVSEGFFDWLANKKADEFYYDKNAQNPWKKCNIYQMSAMAAVVGHEMGHWENEDMLDEFDRDILLRGLGSVFAFVNPWVALGVPVGTRLIGYFSTRQMSFDAEREADRKSMEYALNVPEYSVGGEAIVEYCAYQYKLSQGIEDKVTDWLHPHSKTAKRLERALRYQEELSLGFIQYGNDFDPTFNGGIHCGKTFLYSREKDNFDAVERSFYVLGQIATAIHFDFCKTRCIKIMREDEVFTDGSPQNVVLILDGHGNDYKDHTKIIDTYYNVSMQDAKLWAESPWEKVADKFEALIRQNSELANLAYTRWLIEQYENNRKKYKYKPVE